MLHTWTRELQFHPHVHCLVTGGSLAVERPRWITARRRYLLPVTVLSRLFRGTFLAALARARERGDLHFPGPIADLAAAGAFGALLEVARGTTIAARASRAPSGEGPGGGRTHRTPEPQRRIPIDLPPQIRFRPPDFGMAFRERPPAVALADQTVDAPRAVRE